MAMSRSLIVVSTLMLASIAALPAQDRQTTPKFNSSTELVLVDFVVSDKSDHPVSGLTAKDFIVKEDGKERPIVSFDAFGSGGTVAPPAGQGVASAAPAAATSVPNNASTVVLVDDGQLTMAQGAAAAGDQGVARQGGGAERASLT